MSDVRCQMSDVSRRVAAKLSLISDIYRGLRLHVLCGAICLIALFVALSNQERSASKQLAPQSGTRICKLL